MAFPRVFVSSTCYDLGETRALESVVRVAVVGALFRYSAVAEAHYHYKG